MSALKQILVVRRLLNGECREVDYPQKFQKHTTITVVYWNKTVNMPKMKNVLVVGQMSKTLWYKELQTETRLSTLLKVGQTAMTANDR
jgi:hypothetical protein